MAAFVCVLFTANAAAYGYGYRHHGYDRGYGALHLSFGGGRHRYNRSYRGHRGSSVFFSYSAPLYFGPRYYAPPPVVIYKAPPPVVIYERPVVQVAPRQLPDMPNFAYTPQQGQEPAQTTADRQACESIAWRSSRAGPAGPDPQDLRRLLTDCMQSRGYAVG